MAFEAPTLRAENQLLAGVAFLSVDGARQRLVGEFSWSVSTITRETLAGMDGVHGYSEKPQAGYIEATIRDSGDLTVADFRDMSNVTVTCELANGKVVTAIAAWTTEAQVVETERGTFKVKWESGSVIES